MKKPALYLLVLLLTAATVLTVIARQEPEVVDTMAAVSVTPEVTAVSEITAEPTSEVTATLEITAEPTPEVTAVPEVTATPEITAEPTPEVTATPEMTEALTPEATAVPESTEAPTPEAIGGEMSLAVPGYGGEVIVTIVVDEEGVITAMTAEVGSESPGLGRKCGEDRWLAQFIGRKAPFALAGEAADGMTPVDAISYATITSRALVEAVNTLLSSEAQMSHEPANP